MLNATEVPMVHWRQFRDLKQVIEPRPVAPLPPRAQGRPYTLASYIGGPSHWQLQRTPGPHLAVVKRATHQHGAPRWLAPFKLTPTAEWCRANIGRQPGALRSTSAACMVRCLRGFYYDNLCHSCLARRGHVQPLRAPFRSTTRRTAHCVRRFEARTASKRLNRVLLRS